MEELEGTTAEQAQGFGGDFRGDERVAVAVAADPGAEGQARDVAGGEEFIDGESGIAPGFGEVQVEPVEGGGKEVAQVMDGIAQFAEDIGADEVDFAGAPEGFEGGDDAVADAAAFAVGEFRVFVADELVVEGAVTFAHGTAFGLGWVGGEDRLNIDFFEHVEDFIGAEAEGFHFAEGLRPEAADGFGTEFFFAFAADGGGGAFFDHVEELEADRVELLHASREVAIRDRSAPWEVGDEVVFTDGFQCVTEAFDEKREVVVDEIEALAAEFFPCLISHIWR